MKPTDKIEFIADSTTHNKSNMAEICYLTFACEFTNLGSFIYEAGFAWGVINFSLGEQEGLMGLLDGSLAGPLGKVDSSNYDTISWRVVETGPLCIDNFRAIESPIMTEGWLENRVEDFYNEKLDRMYESFLDYFLTDYQGQIIDEGFFFDEDVSIYRPS